ncbi:hypothetical protein GOP47_0025437 [Adiantum capillus-veneris]|uniref:Nuclear pore protein n=1 Tax=Adiantum capillus-veneris TaxID=13818 RepID=A0A9D4U1B0_ADICA|nr:hypothetical protein GOP47_0025437 [Adiantum capillus-veneris]
MAGDSDMRSWADLLHNSSQLLQAATPSAQFPPIQRSLDQLEALSKKLKARTSRLEAPSQAIAATRLLAREGINADQLTRDLKSFELKTSFEDVFPVEATTVEEYLQQVHEMTMLSAIQEAQRDNIRAFNDYMMKALEDDWQKEKRDFLHTLNRLPLNPPQSGGAPCLGTRQSMQNQIVCIGSKSSQDMPMYTSGNDSILERKAAVYGSVVAKLNACREHGIPFNVAVAFGEACESLGEDIHVSKSVTMRKIWNLVKCLLSEEVEKSKTLTRKMLLILGARHHLEEGHEKYIRDTIQSHPAQAALGGSTGNLQLIRAFLRVRLRDQGALDFDAQHLGRQPPIDTTWHQIFFCLRTGYYKEAKEIAESSRASRTFASQLSEWISTQGLVSGLTVEAAIEECDRMMRAGERPGRAGTDKYKLLVYVIVSGSRQLMDKLLRETPSLFNTIEDFLWFNLAVARDGSSTSSHSSSVGVQWYTIEDLQSYLLKFEPSYYTRNGRDPLVYPYVLFLSLQLHAAVSYLVNESGDNKIDAVHIAIAIADKGVLVTETSSAQTPGSMDSVAEIAGIIRYYGLSYKRQGNLPLALEYYAQAAAAMGGGVTSWNGQTSIHLSRQLQMMLKQLLSEILLSDGGVHLLLGVFGTGSEGSLKRFFPDSQVQQRFLFDVAYQCQESGQYEKAIELLKRVGAFASALDIVNSRLSEAINTTAMGRIDGETRAAGLVLAGNSIIESTRLYDAASFCSTQDREMIAERQTALRQLETILTFHKLARSCKYIDAVLELSKLSFLPLGNWKFDVGMEMLQGVSQNVKSCLPELLKVALMCLDNVPDTDGTVRAMKSKIANFVANFLPKGLPNELYEKVAQML